MRFPEFPNQNQTRSFPLEIIASPVKIVTSGNKPPFFATPNKWPYFLVLICGNSWNYKIPPISDDDPNDSGTLLTVILG
jgi:hypothetical protein